MKKLIIFFPLIAFCFLCSTCKKKTSVEVVLFNYALNEPVANATIVLVERKEAGTFKSDASCKEIASAITDITGRCSFDEEKLRNSSTYKYFFGVTNAYETPDSYPCGGKTSGFLLKGGSQEQILTANDYNGFLVVQQNNLLNPSQLGDSISIVIRSTTYYLPDRLTPMGGGGTLNGYSYNGGNGYPFPAILVSNPIKTPAALKVVKVHKRKMGVVSTSIDTVKVYPNQTTTVVVNW